MDRAGRVVVPKRMRDALGLSPDTPLDIDLVDGRLEISSAYEAPAVTDGSNGPVVAATGTPIAGEDIREMLEDVRAGR